MPNPASIALPVLVIGLLLLGASIGTRSRAAEAPDSPAFHDWDLRRTFGWASSKSTYYNSVQITRVRWRRNTTIARTFEYTTGGQVGLVDAEALESARLIRPPDRMLAMHLEGRVRVRFWGEGDAAGIASEFALRTAKAVHLATTRVWPPDPVAVQIDVYAMPEGVAYSLARKVRWKRGRPLELAIFLPGTSSPEEHRSAAAHELYHLLAAFFRIGRWTDEGAKTPNASVGFEEVAATSFSSCGALLADGHLSRPSKNSTIVLNGTPISAPLSANDVTRLLEVLRYADARSLIDYGTFVGGLLDTAPVFQLLGPTQQSIDLHSPQGEQLLQLCREFSPSPLKVKQWLEEPAARERPPSPG